MADLIDRITGASLLEIPPRPRINVHRLMAAQRLYALGIFTGAQLAAEFDFQGLELVQADQVRAQIDLAVGALNKTIYINRVDSVFICVDDPSDRLYHNADGTANKPKCFTDLLIVGV